MNLSKWVLQCGHIWKKEELIVNMYCFFFFHVFHPCIVIFKCLGVNSKLPKLGFFAYYPNARILAYYYIL